MPERLPNPDDLVRDWWGRLRDSRTRERIARPPSARAALLFVLPLPLLFASLMALAVGQLDPFVTDGLAYALFAAAGALTRRGIAADYRQLARPFSTARSLPLRTFGGILTGVATAFTALLAVGHGLGMSLALTAVALLGFHLCYRLPPLARQPLFDLSDERARKIAAALEEAGGKLGEIERIRGALGNAELSERLDRISLQGRLILRQIAERPDDLYRARKFLNVYLDGVRQVADGYARTHRYTDDVELDQNFRNVLVTVEDVFEEQHRRLLQTDLLDLDVKIDVLRQQMEREGVG